MKHYEKHLKYLDMTFNGKELTIYQIKLGADKQGGYRESLSIPKGSLYSLIVFALRCWRAK